MSLTRLPNPRIILQYLPVLHVVEVAFTRCRSHLRHKFHLSPAAISTYIWAIFTEPKVFPQPLHGMTCKLKLKLS